MSKKKGKKKDANPVGQVTPDEALRRMKDFSDRKEQLIASIKKSKN